MACATLYVVSQVLNSKKGTHNIMSGIESEIKIENSEKKAKELGEENEKSENSEDSEDSETENNEAERNNIVISNVIVDNTNVSAKTNESEIKEEITIKEEFDPDKEYNPFCRNPLGSGANNTFYYELLALVNHFHPSVALFANNIKEGKCIDYTGDPLEDLNLIRFLDRYVFKNPKKLETKKVTRKGDPLAQRAGYVPQGMRSVPVDSEAYLNEREDRIPVDELFLYQFLKKRKDFVKKESEDDEDNESVNSEEFNDMLDGLADNDNLEELDIAGDIVPRKSKKKGNSEDEDESENDESDLDDEEEDFDNENEDFSDDFEDEDMENMDDDDMENIDDDDDDDMENMDDDYSDIDFNDEDSDDDAIRQELSLMKNSQKKFGKKNSKESNENVFMSAEKFAEMMEEQGYSKTKHGASNSMTAVDGAGPKQLKWEAKKNQRSHFGKKQKRKNFSNSKKNTKKQKR